MPRSDGNRRSGRSPVEHELVGQVCAQDTAVSLPRTNPSPTIYAVIEFDVNDVCLLDACHCLLTTRALLCLTEFSLGPCYMVRSVSTRASRLESLCSTVVRTSHGSCSTYPVLCPARTSIYEGYISTCVRTSSPSLNGRTSVPWVFL